MSIVNRIGVIGLGKVGSAIKDLLERQYDVLEYDTEEKSHSKGKVRAVDYAVVCVPTPMNDDGSCDTFYIKKVMQDFSNDIGHFLIKSAIPPGTTDELSKSFQVKLVVSPEYIGEGGYSVPFWKGYPDPKDIFKHQFQIFGGPRKETNRWVEIFQKVMGPEPEYVQTDSRTAELCKYIENAWIATKVTFVNEIFEIADKMNIDYRELRELWLKDGRVSRMHTSVFQGDRGFGGSCLPKDLNALIKASSEEGYHPGLLESVIEVNEKIKD